MGFLEHPNVYLPKRKQGAQVTLDYVQGHGIMTNGEEVSTRPKQFQKPSSSGSLTPSFSSGIHIEDTLFKKHNAFFCFKREEGIIQHEDAAAPVPAGRAELGAAEGAGAAK